MGLVYPLALIRLAGRRFVGFEVREALGVVSMHALHLAEGRARPSSFGIPTSTTPDESPDICKVVFSPANCVSFLLGGLGLSVLPQLTEGKVAVALLVVFFIALNPPVVYLANSRQLVLGMVFIFSSM